MNIEKAYMSVGASCFAVLLFFLLLMFFPDNSVVVIIIDISNIPFLVTTIIYALMAPIVIAPFFKINVLQSKQMHLTPYFKFLLIILLVEYFIYCFGLSLAGYILRANSTFLEIFEWFFVLLLGGVPLVSAPILISSYGAATIWRKRA